MAAFSNTNGMTDEISRSYNSFSGSDITAVIGSYKFAELQAISYAVQREKAPVYCMGSADPRAYSRNKRGIGGTLIWINFDSHALLNIVQRNAGTFVADDDEIMPGYVNVNNGTAIFQTSLTRVNSNVPVSATIEALDTVITSVGQNNIVTAPWYSDQVMPFDVTLTGTNEYGAMFASKIYGVELLNEHSGISVDDAVTEMQATFVARSVSPMSVVQSPFQSALGGVIGNNLQSS
jgi:hypothetical protein